MRRGLLWFWFFTLSLLVSHSWLLAEVYAQTTEDEIVILPSEDGEQSASKAEKREPQREAGKPEGKDKVETLEKVVITATKTPRNPDDVPASITVITAQDLERQNIKTADQAIAQVPGAFDSRGKGWVDNMASVTLRGLPEQKRTLVLLDGQNMASSYSNSVVWNSFSVEEIERIEVIRGPFSALYGGNAMGGVINVITKTPKQLEMVAGSFSGRYDSWGYYLGAGDLLGDQLSLKVSYNSRYTSGYPSEKMTTSATNTLTAAQRRSVVSSVAGYRYVFSPQGKPHYIIGDTGDNTFQDSMATAKLVWDPAPGHKISFSTNLYWSDYGYKPFHTYLFNPRNGDPITSGNRQLIGPGQTSWFTGLSESSFLSSEGRSAVAIYNLSSENKLTDTTTLKLKGGLVNNTANYYVDGSTDYFTSRGTVHNTPSKNYSFEGQIEQLIGKQQVLTAGMTYATGFAGTTDWALNMFRDPDSKTDLVSYSEGKDRLMGLYLQDEINWHPQFNTIIGGRLDFWQTYEGKVANFKAVPKIWNTNLPRREQVSFNPKIAFLYRPWECLTGRASVGTAFRPPNIFELYRTTTLGRNIYKGNPYLKPETSLSWEVGATLKPFRGNVISATFFDSYIGDLIYTTTDPGYTNVRNRENAGKARIYGLELEVTQKLFSWLEVFANMTLTDPRVVKNPKAPLSVGKQLTSSPRESVNFGINLKYWKVNANLSGRYVSKVYSYDDNSDGINNTPGSYDPYFTLNTKVTFTPVKYADISLSVDNILNRQYYYNALTPGRMGWIEAKLKY